MAENEQTPPQSMPEGSNEEYTFGWFVVCIIDILGQKNALDAWSEIPSTKEPTQEFIESVRNTAGKVLWLREAFEKYYQAFKGRSPLQSHIGNLPADALDEHKRFRVHELKQQRFSDTFVFYAPLITAHGDMSLLHLYQMLASAKMAMLVGLAGKAPVRGAICIGTGTELDDGDFYGPGLSMAHHLESEIANYPRIVVSDKVVRLLRNEKQRFSENYRINDAVKAMRPACLKLITDDVDGHLIIDWLNEEPKKADFIQLAKDAYQFVCSEALRFRQERNMKLSARYHLLKNYMDTRLTEWGWKTCN